MPSGTRRSSSALTARSPAPPAWKPETIEALARGEAPAELPDAARDFTHALVTRHAVDEATYGAAQSAFGDEGLVGLTHPIGLYLSVSAVLTAFRVHAPNAALSAPPEE